MPALTILIARLARPRPEQQAPRVIARAATRLSAEEQLSRVSLIARASLDRARTSSRYQAAAEIQLDAASYALRELMRDLATVMTLPERRAASLYQLPPAPARVLARRRVAAAA